MESGKEAEKIIQNLCLEPHPEGGYFRQTYRSDMVVTSPSAGEPRAAVTDIYYMLISGQWSRFHRVLHDEVWNFYEGGPLRLYDFNPANSVVVEIKLGALSVADTRKHVVPAGHWQAAAPDGDYALVGCTVAPGFDFADFSFFSEDSNERHELLRIRPDLDWLI